MSTPQQVLSEQDMDDLARQCAIPGHASMIDHRAYGRAILAKLQAAPQAQPEQAAQGVGEVVAYITTDCNGYALARAKGKWPHQDWIDNGWKPLVVQDAHPAPSPAVALPEGWKLLKTTTHEERSWPEDARHENGSYWNTCLDCGRQFTGHKRRRVCKACDAALATQQAQTAQQAGG